VVRRQAKKPSNCSWTSPSYSDVLELPLLRTKLRTYDGADAIKVVRFRHDQGINLNAALDHQAGTAGTDEREASDGVVAGDGVRFSTREILLLAPPSP
jgi:hypothetical protein